MQPRPSAANLAGARKLSMGPAAMGPPRRPMTMAQLRVHMLYEGPSCWSSKTPSQKYECIKCTFYILNTLLCALGIAALSVTGIQVGQYLAMKTDDDTNLNTRVKALQASGLLGLVMAVLTLIQTLFGCCGMSCGSKCCLNMYLVFSGLLLVFHLTSMCVASYQISAFVTFKDRLLEVIKDYDGTTSPDSYYLDYNQVKLRCCGVESYKDYQKSAWYKNSRKGGQEIPYSCCALKDEARLRSYDFATQALTTEELFDESCPMNPMGKPYAIQPCLSLIEENEHMGFVLNLIHALFGGMLLIGMMASAFKVRMVVR